MIVQSILKKIRYFLAPPFCAQCKQFLLEPSVFCERCAQDITPIVSTTIKLTDTYSMTLFAVSDYKKPIKSLILAKSRSDYIAGHELGTLIWKTTMLRHQPLDYLIPIPLHKTRLLYRGFNQAHIMAKKLSAYADKPIASILIRNKKTVFQSTLTHALRHENVKNAFTLNIDNPALYHNKHLILVDDLSTTGATLKQAAKELIKLNPASISAVVACRVI